MSLQISPFGNDQFLTSAGLLAGGYKLFTYLSGSSTKEAVFADINGASKHTNPIVLNVGGMTPYPVYIDTSKKYKFVYALPTDTDPPSAPLYVVDQLGVGLEGSIVPASEWVTGDPPTFVSTTSFSVTGNQTGTYHVGRRIKAVSNVATLYGTITASVFGAVTTVTVVLDSGILDVTLSAIYYAFLSASGSSFPGGFTTGLTTTLNGPLVIPLNSDFNLFPVGCINLYAGNVSPPLGYLACNGAAVSRTTYAALFGSVGTTFGAGDGSTTFNVPNIANLATNVKYVIRYA